MTRELTVSMLLAVFTFCWMHSADLGHPSRISAALNSAPIGTFLAMAGKGATCEMRGAGSLVGVTARPTDCGVQEANRMLEQHIHATGLLGMLPRGSASQASGVREPGDGTFRSGPPRVDSLAEIRGKRCFPTDPYSVGDRGLHLVSEAPRFGDDIALDRWLDVDDRSAMAVGNTTPAQRDAALLAYFHTRKAHGETIHRFFGEEGLRVASMRYGNASNSAAITALRQRLRDAHFGAGLDPLERAEIDLLAANPTDFVPCIARQTRA